MNYINYLILIGNLLEVKIVRHFFSYMGLVMTIRVYIKLWISLSKLFSRLETNKSGKAASYGIRHFHMYDLRNISVTLLNAVLWLTWC